MANQEMLQMRQQKIVYEIEGQIRFHITDAGFVQLEFTPEKLIEVVEDELSEGGTYGYCEKYGLMFKG